MLTAEEARALFEYDPETGVLTRRGREAGWLNKALGYRQVSITLRGQREVHYTHRLAWLLYYGAWPQHRVDHINRNPLDNRIGNLRDVPPRINSENSNAWGVTYYRWGNRTKRWKPQIVVHGKHIPLGYYSTEEEARAVYLEAKRKLHAGYIE